eukprot:Skav233502  [mRNA]  locus=scaffold2687:200066:204367:- [translate_table: standard]
MAAEVVKKFPEASDKPPLLHEVNEGCVEEWAEQLGEALELLRSLRPNGASVNVSCQMGTWAAARLEVEPRGELCGGWQQRRDSPCKNRSAAAILVWMCSEGGWKLEAAVEHLRSITALACGNPYLIDAVAKFLQVEVDIPLNDAGEDGHWICISPPGTPRDLQPSDASLDVQPAGPRAPPPEAEAESCELAGLFEGI